MVLVIFLQTLVYELKTIQTEFKKTSKKQSTTSAHFDSFQLQQAMLFLFKRKRYKCIRLKSSSCRQIQFYGAL
jgi:hypothetical protein